MKIYPRGSTAILESDWRKYENGPFEDVTDLEIKITNMASLAVEVDTDQDIIHVSTGSYKYDWPIPAEQDMTAYQALWTGLNSLGAVVQAAEVFQVGPALVSTADEIAQFRLAVDEPDNTAPYTDLYLDQLLQQYGAAQAVGVVWRQKAAAASSLVDTSESGSSRKMSQIQDHYLKMAAMADADAAPVDPLAGYAYTVPIERA